MVAGAIVLLLLPTLLTHFLFWRLERRLDLKVNKKPLFVFTPGSIYLKEVDIQFKDYLRINSGSVQIRYPLSLIFYSTFYLKIEGQNLAVVPSAHLMQVLGEKEVIFDRVSAKLFIRPDRKVSFDYLDAESKTVQFHLGSKNP